MTVTTPDLPLLGLDSEQQHLIEELRRRHLDHLWHFELRNAYYNGEQLIRDLGISIPPQLRGMHTVLSWPEIVVDSLAERLHVEGFRLPGESSTNDELWQIWNDNHLTRESYLAHVDAMIFGRAYAVVGSNEIDGRSPRITVESPMHLIDDYDPRTDTINAALRLIGKRNPGAPSHATLYLPNETIWLEEQQGYLSNHWGIIDRDVHNLGIVPVVRLVNRQRIHERHGYSEISKSVMSIVDAACRALLRLELAAEFFSAPQRYILGASEEDFQRPDGTATSAWETYIGRVLVVERDEDGNVPSVGAFPTADPTNQTRIVDLYREEISVKTGLPPHYLGSTTANPSSAEAIRAAESRLITRAELKQVEFSVWGSQVMPLALYVRDGVWPEQGNGISTEWRNAATPTVAASTDAAVKLVAAGILPPQSDVVLKMVGLSPGQIQQVQAERVKQSAMETLAQVAANITAAQNMEGE